MKIILGKMTAIQKIIDMSMTKRIKTKKADINLCMFFWPYSYLEWKLCLLALGIYNNNLSI